MTEAEWMACVEPMRMLRTLEGKVSERKMRLLACACARRLWHVLDDHRCRNAIEVAERFADARADTEQLRVAMHEAEPGPEANSDSRFARLAAAQAATYHAGQLPFAVHFAGEAAIYRAFCDAIAAGARRVLGDPKAAERTVQCTLIRDIVGTPFGYPPAIAVNWLSWNDGTIQKMAQAIYDDRAFDRLPLLADALDDAGCTDAAILSHCRVPGEHVRGCWVVDLLLGKS